MENGVPVSHSIDVVLSGMIVNLVFPVAAIHTLYQALRAVQRLYPCDSQRGILLAASTLRFGHPTAKRTHILLSNVKDKLGCSVYQRLREQRID